MINGLINNLPYVGAAATIATANVLFAELADRIARFVELQIFGNWPIPFMVPPTPIVATRIIVNILSVCAMNIALNKLLTFPFNPWVTAGLSVFTAVIYQRRLYNLGLQIAYATAAMAVRGQS